MIIAGLAAIALAALLCGKWIKECYDYVYKEEHYYNDFDEEL